MVATDVASSRPDIITNFIFSEITLLSVAEARELYLTASFVNGLLSVAFINTYSVRNTRNYGYNQSAPVSS